MRRLNAGARNTDPDGQKSATMESVKSLHIKQYPIHRSGNSNPFSKPVKFKSLMLFASIAAITLGIAFYLLFGSRRLGTGRKFGIIIDGGSTGTRIHVFEYRIEDGMPKFDFGPRGLSSMRVNPGLSSYAEDPQEAGESLVELLKFAKERVPGEFRGNTEIRLMATAGLRLLDVKLQDRILSSCREVLRSSEFKFLDSWASVITGLDEGLYAWVAANYALGSLGGDPQQTTGIIELGGASIQVTFASNKEVPAEYSRSIEFGNVIYNLYSQSLLHFGQNVAFASVKELLRSNNLNLASGSPIKESIIDPCTLKGYVPEVDAQQSSSGPSSEKGVPALLAQGNFSDCKDAAQMLFEGKDQCSSQQCSARSPLLPKVKGKLLATENFFYTSEFFRLDPKAPLSDFVEAGQNFCESEWSSVRRKHPLIHEEDLLHYCFSSAYIVALLHDHLGVAMDDQTITYANQVKQMPLDWALGAFILQSAAGTSGNHLDWIPGFLRIEFPNLFLVLAATGILCFVVWSFSKMKNPYLKTIYDLEKGRYIITRISR